MVDINIMPFARLMGVRVVEAAPNRVVAEMPVREDFCTVNSVLHGGAVMAFADSVGALATVLNLPPGAGTTTVESKTNFVGAIKAGDIARAECSPVHVGRTTMVWQTRILRGDGKLAALVTQTQMVLAVASPPSR
jgi:1,4-dihydroxy-2-naphthoyl-CoA hydrolase